MCALFHYTTEALWLQNFIFYISESTVYVLTNFKIDDDNYMALDCEMYHDFIEDLQIGGMAPEGKEAMLVMWDFM